MALRPSGTTDQGTVTVHRPQAIRSDMPLPPVMTALRAQRAQRQATTQITDGVSVEPPATGVVQRAAFLVAEPPGKQTSAPPEQDLEKLAQDIYPIIRRRLAIERERRTGRW